MKKRFKNFKRNAFVLFAIIVSVLVSLVSPMLSVSEYVSAADNNNLASIYPSKMTKLKLTSVYSGQLVDGTVNTTQSFVVTDKYFVAVQAQSAKENAGWIIATDIKKPNSKPVWKTKYNIGHGNGATWNSRTNQIVIIDKDVKIYFDANTGKFVKKVSVGPAATGIAYDGDDDMYVQTNGSEKGSGQILTKNFQLVRSFDARHRLVNQDVGYYGGHIYRIGYGGCNYLDLVKRKDDAAYCRKYFGESSNVIYQFNMQGDYVKAYYIEAGFGELESLDFASDGTMYLMFNGKPKKGYYAVYKATNFKADKIKSGVASSREIASVGSIKIVEREAVSSEQNAALVERLNALYEQEENANGRLDAKAEENSALAGRTIAEVESVKVDESNSEETKQIAKVEQMKKKIEQATSVDVAEVDVKAANALDGVNGFVDDINRVINTTYDHEEKNMNIDDNNGNNSASINADIDSDAYDNTDDSANVISDISYIIIEQNSSGLVKKAQDNLVLENITSDNAASNDEQIVERADGEEIARETDENADKNADLWDVEIAKVKNDLGEGFNSSEHVFNTNASEAGATDNFDIVRRVVTIVVVTAGLLAVGWFVTVIVRNMY